jgi:hypothetical protein
MRLFILLTLFTSLFTGGCKRNSNIEDQRYTWSTEAPLTIPYRARLQRFEKGNLVRNHSFETGRTFVLDNSTSSFVIDGWQQVGQHVRWVDTRSETLYHPDEAWSGYRAVKIIRDNAYETDEQGDGIMSDFIKVIPGNYILSLFVKLEDIRPVRTRLGISMYDAVDVRLLYFDRNKNPVSSQMRFPQADQYVDNSFKSLSFANYSRIDNFGWGRLIGKTAHFPFPDGDIPTEAHYVKLVIGLKAKGTMWIDSVNFSYSDRNFSVAERMVDYTDTTLLPYEAIVPTPKKYQKMESVVFRVQGMDPEKLPLIVIPAQADALILKAAGLLQDALHIPDKQIVFDSDHLQISQARLVFNMGSTGLFEEYRESLPTKAIQGHPQGYFIHAPANMPNLVFLGGNNSTGILYAALTVLQMIEKKQPVFHNARIVDYPDFPDRYCVFTKSKHEGDLQQNRLVEELVRYKVNGAFREDLSFDSDRFVGIFSFAEFPDFAKPADSTLTCIFPEDCSGYRIFHNQLLDYCGFEHDTDRKGKETRNFYAGCSYFSMNTDDADIDRYIAFSGSRPVFMDNSMQIYTHWGHYAGNDPWYPGKVRLFNIFEPFTNADIREHFSKLDTTMFLINFSPHSEIDLIRMATAADFMWNSATYARDHSLWKVLQSRYGSMTSRYLVRYADRYGLFLEGMLRIKQNESVPRNLKICQQTLEELDMIIDSVRKYIEKDSRLLQELQALNAEAQEEVNRIAVSRHLLN